MSHSELAQASAHPKKRLGEGVFRLHPGALEHPQGVGRVRHCLVEGP